MSIYPKPPAGYRPMPVRRESGMYPPGAEHDPNAPWNQRDEGEEEKDEPDPDYLRDQQIDDKLTGDA